MFHLVRQVAFWVLVAVVIQRWELVVVSAGMEILSQSFHASQHHPETLLARVWLKIAAGGVALFGALLLW